MVSKLFEIFDYNFIEFNHFKVSLLSIFWVLFIFLLVKIFLRIFQLILHHNFSKRKLIDRAREFTIVSLVSYLVYVLAAIIALGSIGVDLTYLFAGSAALLVGLGLGLQSLFKDFVAGIVLLFEGAYKVDDIIEMEGKVLQVKKIDLRTSKLETADGHILITPNSKMLENSIANWSANKKDTRLKIVVGVAYGSDLNVVRHALQHCAAKHPMVSKQRKPLVHLSDFGDSAIVLTLYFWSNRIDNLEIIKSEVRFDVEQIFRENGIQIPFPQRELHIMNSKE